MAVELTLVEFSRPVLNAGAVENVQNFYRMVEKLGFYFLNF